MVLASACFVYRFAPGLLSLAALLFLWRQHFSWALFAFSPFLFLGFFFLSLFLFRATLPRLKPGVHSEGSAPYVAWRLRQALEESADAFTLAPWIRSSYLFRYLWCRALGAKVDLTASAALDAKLSDLSLLRVGAGCTLGLGSELKAHALEGGRLRIGPVTLGRGVFVGTQSRIGPDVELGDGAWVGIGCHLANERRPAGSRLEDYSVSGPA